MEYITSNHRYTPGVGAIALAAHATANETIQPLAKIFSNSSKQSYATVLDRAYAALGKMGAQTLTAQDVTYLTSLKATLEQSRNNIKVHGVHKARTQAGFDKVLSSIDALTQNASKHIIDNTSQFTINPVDSASVFSQYTTDDVTSSPMYEQPPTLRIVPDSIDVSAETDYVPSQTAGRNFGPKTNLKQRSRFGWMAAGFVAAAGLTLAACMSSDENKSRSSVLPQYDRNGKLVTLAGADHISAALQQGKVVIPTMRGSPTFTQEEYSALTGIPARAATVPKATEPTTILSPPVTDDVKQPGSIVASIPAIKTTNLEVSTQDDAPIDVVADLVDAKPNVTSKKILDLFPFNNTNAFLPSLGYVTQPTSSNIFEQLSVFSAPSMSMIGADAANTITVSTLPEVSNNASDAEITALMTEAMEWQPPANASQLETRLKVLEEQRVAAVASLKPYKIGSSEYFEARRASPLDAVLKEMGTIREQLTNPLQVRVEKKVQEYEVPTDDLSVTDAVQRTVIDLPNTTVIEPQVQPQPLVTESQVQPARTTSTLEEQVLQLAPGITPITSDYMTSNAFANDQFLVEVEQYIPKIGRQHTYYVASKQQARALRDLDYKSSDVTVVSQPDIVLYVSDFIHSTLAKGTDRHVANVSVFALDYGIGMKKQVFNKPLTTSNNAEFIQTADELATVMENQRNLGVDQNSFNLALSGTKNPMKAQIMEWAVANAGADDISVLDRAFVAAKAASIGMPINNGFIGTNVAFNLLPVPKKGDLQ